MGVQGLWKLIDAAGKPIPLERLENQVLAIDVSIWLNQSLAGFRDAAGGSVSQAHLLGLFHRICKLLFYRIKPVFVFDGRPPQIKKDMIAKRRMKKSGASKKAEKTRHKIIDNYLKQQAVASQLQRQTTAVNKVLEKGQAGLANLLSQRKGPQEKDLFELPKTEMNDDDMGDSDSDSEREDVLGKLDIDHSTDIHLVNLDRDEFRSLSAEQKYEVLVELREKRKQSSWAKINEMPREAMSFSGYQFERLLKRREIQRKMDNVGNEITDDQMAVADEQLFVGDREGLRKERHAKKKIIGKDFVYLSGIEVGRGGKELTEFEQSLADRFESEDGVTQDELLALAKKDEASGSASVDLVEPSSVFSSSRRGGVRLEDDDSEEEDEPRPSTSSGVFASKGKVKAVTTATVQIDFSALAANPLIVEEDIFADVFGGVGGRKRNASSSTSEFQSSDDEKEEKKKAGDDIFADVFANKDEVSKLDQILTRCAPTQADDDDDRLGVMEAAAMADSVEEMFASVTKRTRKFEDSGETVMSAKRPKKDEVPKVGSINASLASTMKESSHLFLKIASKYAAEGGPELEKEKEKKTLDSSPEKSELSKMLEDENRALIDEMRKIENEQRLMRIKQSVQSSIAPKAKAAAPAPASKADREEVKLLKSLDVDAREKEAYTKSVLRGEGVENEEEDHVATVYGSAAPGFVRSRRSGNVVEVLGRDVDANDAVPDLDESIAIKLESTEDEDNVLTENELRSIQERLALAGNTLIAERGRQERISATVSDQMYADCQELMQMFGLPWVVAPSEAEAQCAFLDMVGMSDGSVTDDSDIWLFGGQRVFKNFFNQEKHCESFTSAEVGKHYGLSREKMILLALLTGSDYTDGIPDVGPVTAMEILAEFPGTGVEPLKEFKKWWNEQQGSGKLPVGNKNREKLRRLHVPNSFPSPKVSDAYLFPSVDNSTEAFSWAVPNFVEIRDFAQEKFGWTRQKVDELIKPVIKRFDERVTQAKIDRFFLSDRSSLPSKGHLQNSKRVQSAVEKVLGRKSLESDDIGGKKVTKKTSPGKKKATPSPAAKPLLSRLEAEEARKMDAKAKAAEMLKMKGPTRQRKKKATRGPKRLVMAKHNLSESDSSDG